MIDRHRQQALLAALVAVGLALIAIPAQRHAVSSAVAAAERALVSGGSAHRADRQPPGPADRPARPSPAAPGQPVPSRLATGTAAPVPSASTPPQPPTPTPSATPTGSGPAVPPGAGSGRPVRTTGSTAIALTFDDGPDPVQTPRLLALLARYHVRATFCLIGRNAEKYPEIVRQIVAAGHTLCNHSWDHSLVIGQASAEAIRADLDRTNAAIRAAVPNAAIPFFRAPGGRFTDRLVTVAEAAGMVSLSWEVDPRDWDHSTDADDAAHADRVIGEIRRDVKPGAIVLSHDFEEPDTVTAYERLLPYLTRTFTIGQAHPAGR